jgi:hypothetical protein
MALLARSTVSRPVARAPVSTRVVSVRRVVVRSTPVSACWGQLGAAACPVTLSVLPLPQPNFRRLSLVVACRTAPFSAMNAKRG